MVIDIGVHQNRTHLDVKRLTAAEWAYIRGQLTEEAVHCKNIEAEYLRLQNCNATTMAPSTCTFTTEYNI